MTEIHLPDLDDLTGGPGTYLPVFYQFADISPGQWAEMSREVWHIQPLQERNGFHRVKAHLWSVGDWFLSENQIPAMLTQAESHHLQDVGPQINFERTLWLLFAREFQSHCPAPVRQQSESAHTWPRRHRARYLIALQFHS